MRATYLKDDHHGGVLKPNQKNMKTKTWETLMELCNHIEEDEDENMRRQWDNTMKNLRRWQK